MKQSLADSLRATCKKQKLTAYRISKDSGVPITSVQRFLDGSTEVATSKLELIAKAVGFKGQWQPIK